MEKKLDYRDEAEVLAGCEEMEKAIIASLLHAQGKGGGSLCSGMEGQ